jgi:hypothetical protein
MPEIRRQEFARRVRRVTRAANPSDPHLLNCRIAEIRTYQRVECLLGGVREWIEKVNAIARKPTRDKRLFSIGKLIAIAF